MPISFSSPTNRDARARGAGVTAVLGPTNTGKTHLAIERMLGHSSGMIGLPLRLLAREVYNKMRRAGRRRRGRADHRRGEDQARRIRASGSRPSRRCRATSTSPSSPSTRSSSAPISSAATSSPTACSTGAAARRRCCSAPPPCGRSSRSCCPARNVVTPAAPVAAHLRGREEDHPPAAPHRHRRLLGRRGLRHRRADPPPARRRRGGARLALAAHAQRPGRALPVRRRRLSGRHRRHRHGPQSRRRSRRLRLRPQVRRLSVPPAQPGRVRPDRRPRRPRHARRHLRHHRPLPAVRDDLVQALESHRSSRSRCCSGATPTLDFSSLGALQASLAEAPTEHGLTRAPVAEDILVLDHAARDDDVRGMATTPEAVARLWDVCQVPDYRKIAPATHAELVVTLFGFLMRDGTIPTTGSPARSRSPTTPTATSTRSPTASPISAPGPSRPTGRTGSPIPTIGRGVTRAIEDKLSDALHERLTDRFVDRRTSVLMRRLRENTMLETEITQDRRSGGRRPRHRPARRLPLHARGAVGAAPRPRRSRAPPRRRSPARSTRAQARLATGVRRPVRAGRPTARSAGRASRSASSSAGRRGAEAARAHPRRRASDRRLARRRAGAARPLAQGPCREAA